MIGPEYIFQRKVLKWIRSLQDVWVIKTREINTRGIPDILACITGDFYALEIKAYKKKPTKLQANELKKIENAGGFSYVLYPENFEKFKRDILQRYPLTVPASFKKSGYC